MAHIYIYMCFITIGKE